MQVVLNNYPLLMLVNVNLWSCTRKTLKKNPDSRDSPCCVHWKRAPVKLLDKSKRRTLTFMH